MTHDKDTYYVAGKQARLNGEPIENSQSISGELNRYDWRCGHRVADSNIEHHPDWSPAYILS